MRVLQFCSLLLLASNNAYSLPTEVFSGIEIFESSSVESSSESTLADSSSGCLGAPYLYITLHHEKTNVLKFTRDGCLVSDRVLVGGPSMDMNFRSMVINNNGDLIIANAADDVNQILVFGSCSNSTSTAPLARRTQDRQQKAPIHVLREESGQRIFKGIVTDLKMNRGAEHPYGLALDADQVCTKGLIEKYEERQRETVTETETDRSIDRLPENDAAEFEIRDPFKSLEGMTPKANTHSSTLIRYRCH
jgi:hypothetical protein